MPARRDAIHDVVVLLPGFLGFSRFGGFRYFADRVSATLRGALEERLGYTVPVVPFSTLPTASLVERQERILGLLDKLHAELGGRVDRYHLVGHSTGGVDAELLGCTEPLGGGQWKDHAGFAPRSLLASVMGLAAPYRGTGLAVGAGARFFGRPRLDLAELRAVLRPIFDLVMDVLRSRYTVAEALGGVAMAPREVARFLEQVLRNRALIGDLAPSEMEARCEHFRIDPQLRFRSFVTMVPRDAPDSMRDPTNRFFEDLYDLTAAAGEVAPSDGVERSIGVLRATLRDRPELVVRAGDDLLPLLSAALAEPAHVGEQVNDGLVNSARQLRGDDDRELAAIVVADHADVIGHYDREDPYVRDQAGAASPLNAGLLHSPSRFGDDEFFALYRRIADEVVTAARA